MSAQAALADAFKTKCRQASDDGLVTNDSEAPKDDYDTYEDEDSDDERDSQRFGGGSGRNLRAKERSMARAHFRGTASHSARARKIHRKLSQAQREWVEAHAKRLIPKGDKRKQGKKAVETAAKELAREAHEEHGVAGLVKLLELKGDNSSVVVEVCREIFKVCIPPCPRWVCCSQAFTRELKTYSQLLCSIQTAVEGERVARLRLKRSGALLGVLNILDASRDIDDIGKEHMVIAACAETLKMCAQDEDICAYLVEKEALHTGMSLLGSIAQTFSIPTILTSQNMTVRKALKRMKKKRGPEAEAIVGLVKDLAGKLALATLEL